MNEEKLKEMIQSYKDDPCKWAEEVMGIKLYKYQKEFVKRMYSSNPIDIKNAWYKSRGRCRGGWEICRMIEVLKGCGDDVE